MTSAFMGLIGITEGAIPFAVKDIKHVLPAIMGGSAVGAGLAMMHAIECYVPHGLSLIHILRLARGCCGETIKQR